MASLKLSDPRYGELQTHSVGLEIAKALAEPAPYDLDEVDLTSYKGLKPPWTNWDKVATICVRYGLLFAEALIEGTEP